MRGEAWVVPGIGDVRALRPGDVAIMRGPDPYTVADDPATPPQVIIHPGQHCTTAAGDRLLDLLLVAVLRAWFARPEAGAPAWYRANGDPVVGRALRMLHNNPAHPWTLAAATGVSRAALARRFTDLVGEPPMTFLTGWRLALAADLLRDSDATIGAVARQVGYGSSFALSTAFTRVRGISPQQHRLGGEAGR